MNYIRKFRNIPTCILPIDFQQSHQGNSMGESLSVNSAGRTGYVCEKYEP